MEFERYMSLKRFGTEEVTNINYGKCYIFPKLDGTNASCWMKDGEMQAGSRNRLLDESSKGDNGGFCKWVREQSNINVFLKHNPHLRLFGEWLIPHSLKTYREDAWRKFYVFDVYNHLEDRFLTYEEYAPMMEEFKIDYIPLLWTMENPTVDRLLPLLEQNTYLIQNGMGFGEGIVIKNYGFKNRYGRVTWAKLVSNEFREQHTKKHGVVNIEHQKSVEEMIIDKYFTTAFIEKEYHKLLLQMANEGRTWTPKSIPELLGRMYSELIKEECYNFVKYFKNPTVNFRTLNGLCLSKVKVTLVDIFNNKNESDKCA